MNRENTRSRAALWSLAAACMLANASAFATPATTTLGTRSATSQANTALTSNASASWSTYSRAATYPGAITLPLQFITLSTGKKLAVLVSVPADANGKAIAGAFPAILTQTAYRIDLGQLIGGILPSNTTLLIGGQDKYMITRGYISVAVDILGSGMSSGEEKLIGAEEQAAYGETVNWVTQQPWFNGNLGLAGTSYLGITSLLTAEQQNPAVKAVFAEVPMGDPYRATVAPGGLMNADFISTWLTLTQNLSVANGSAETNYPQYAAQIAAANTEHVAAINDWFLPTVNNALAGTPGYATDDGTFWSVRSSLENASKIKVPTFIVGGTNDIFQRDEPLLFEQLKNNVNSKLLIVPGAHVEAILSATSNNNNAIATGAPDSETLLLQWFDQYLKGINTGAATIPNVTQYVAGYGLLGDRYATTTDWPHPKAAPQRFYLHGNGSLNTTAPTASEASHTVSEPAAPTVAISTSNGGTNLQASVTTNDGSACSSSNVQWSLGIAGLLGLPCFTNDATVESSQNALTYTTAVSLSNMYINGPIEADIWMSATNAQAAITVRVDDVDLLGNATPLTTGIMSAAYRAVDTSRSRYINGVMIQPWHPFTSASVLPLVANQPVLVPVEVFPAAALIRVGHRLRIAISSSNQVEGIWTTPQQVSATGNVSRIYNDAAHPSSVVLPVVPASVLN
jgi:putative CocE/NonD family hydrolase